MPRAAEPASPGASTIGIPAGRPQQSVGMLVGVADDLSELRGEARQEGQVDPGGERDGG